MKLQNGENIILSDYGNVFEVEFLNAPLIRGIVEGEGSADQLTFNRNEIFNLNKLNSDIVFVTKGSNSISFKVDGQYVCATVENDLSSHKWYEIGKLYRYNGQWRYRSLLNEVQGFVPRHTNSTMMQTVAVRELKPATYQEPTIRHYPNQSYYDNRIIPANSVEVGKMSYQDIPSNIRNLHLKFSWKSYDSKSGLLQKIVTPQTLTVNMDFSAILFDRNGSMLEGIGSLNNRSRDTSLYHFGDNSEGLKNIRAEMIQISLSNLSPEISFIVLTVTSKEDHRFNLIEESKLEIKNQEGMSPILSFKLSNGEDKAGCLVGILARTARGTWKFLSIESYEKAKSYIELKDLASNWIRFMSSDHLN